VTKPTGKGRPPPKPTEKTAPAPPPKPKDELAEVERALSVLGGHHPEHERARREVTEAMTKKRVGDTAAAQEAARVLRKRLAIGGAAVLVAGVIAYAGWGRHAHAVALERSLEGQTATFAVRGFVPLATGEVQLEAAIEPGCYVAVTPEGGDGKLEVEHGGETLTGAGSVGWCACTPEKASARAAGAVRFLRVDGKAVGNVDGLAAVEPHPATTSKREEDCAAEHLDAWLAEKKLPPAPVEPEAMAGREALAPLVVAGFSPVASLPADRSFALVDGGGESCFLAWSKEPTDTLTLRLPGGARPIVGEKGGVAWCSESARLVTLWRQGRGHVTIARAQASRVGGLLGLKERVQRKAAFLPFTAWVGAEELAWDAVQALRGSAVGEATIALSGTETESRAGGDPRIVAISLLQGGSFVSDRRGDVPYFCHPRAETGALEMLCAQLAPQTWRQTGALGSVGIAQAPLPFWLTIFAEVKDPELAKSLVALLILARRLHGDGFEPTTLVGVVEEASGVNVTGRGGDDAVVAVGLGPKAPWVFPYSDGQEWQLAGEPRVVELKPGERVVLSSVQTPTVPKEQRRTVVFRRAVRKPAN
jgi:hypothetical protein